MKWMIALLLLVSCGPQTARDCRREAEGAMRALCTQLEQVRTREDLVAREEKLKKHYTKLADLTIAAQQLGGSVEAPNEKLNRRLRDELVRVYSIPGGREVMERAQGEALHRLADIKSVC